ncbi:MAG: HAD family hydrolase [Chloroflexota bacterium]
MTDSIRRIAMWSGPRNISTAMMRSWGSRADTFVHDEPFYANYLTKTHHTHPGEDEVVAVHENDWQKVVEQITGPVPDGSIIYYQKHMTHHMLDHIALDWILEMTNCFLIREPREVILSLAKKLPTDPQLDQTGIPRQLELFEYVRDMTGKIPPVIDAKDVLTDPRRTLTRLCEALDLPFDDAMLQWEPGRRATDGVWAKYWYASVEQSTGFKPYQPNPEPVPEHLQPVVDECEALYQQLAVHRL